VPVVSKQSKQMLTVLVEAGIALLAAIAMTLAFAGELVSESGLTPFAG
jgi:formate dehydrogenase assembly factor FdhD